MEFYKKKKINDMSNIKKISKKYLQIELLTFKVLKFQIAIH